MGITSEDIEFYGFHGEELSGKLDWPASWPVAYAVFSHCFTGSKDFKGSSQIAEGLARHGIATLRFDFPGLGDSDGSFGEANFATNVNDIVCAANFLKMRHEAPTILVGHSLGGAATLVASHQIPSAKVVITIGSPYDPEHVTHIFKDVLAQVEMEGEAMVDLKGRRFNIQKHQLEALRQQRPEIVIAELGKTLLSFHSPDDDIVGPQNAEQIFATATYPKNKISMPGTHHLIRDPNDAVFITNVIGAWVRRYLGTE